MMDTTAIESSIFSGFEILIQNIVRENNIKRSLIARKKLQAAEIEKDIVRKEERIKLLKERKNSRQLQNNQLQQSNMLRQSNVERLRQHVKLLEEHECSLRRQLTTKKLETKHRLQKLDSLRQRAQEAHQTQEAKYASLPAVRLIKELKQKMNNSHIGSANTISDSNAQAEVEEPSETVSDASAFSDQEDDQPATSPNFPVDSLLLAGNRRSEQSDGDDEIQSKQLPTQKSSSFHLTKPNVTFAQMDESYMESVASPGSESVHSKEISLQEKSAVAKSPVVSPHAPSPKRPEEFLMPCVPNTSRSRSFVAVSSKTAAGTPPPAKENSPAIDHLSSKVAAIDVHVTKEREKNSNRRSKLTCDSKEEEEDVFFDASEDAGPSIETHGIFHNSQLGETTMDFLCAAKSPEPDDQFQLFGTSGSECSEKSPEGNTSFTFFVNSQERHDQYDNDGKGFEDIFGFSNTEKEEDDDNCDVLEALFGKQSSSDNDDGSFQPLF